MKKFFRTLQFRHFVIGLSLLFSAAFGFALAEAGNFLVLPAQRFEKADLIVALGGDGGGRILKALELYQRGFAPVVLLTGIEDGHGDSRPYYRNWRVRLMVGQGVPESVLMFDTLSDNSWQEAQNTLELMRAHNWKRALIVSDPPHLRRLAWVWGKAFAGSGKEFLLIGSPMDQWNPARWWMNAKSARYVVSEYLKLGYYRLVH